MDCISWFARVLLAALLPISPLVYAEDATVYRGALVASMKEAPADIVAATLSTVALLRGLPDPALLRPVTFATGLPEKLRDVHTRFEGFDLAGFRLSYLGPSASGQSGRRIIGTLIFVDGSGRRAEQGYALDYSLQGQGLLLHDGAIGRQAPLRPRVQMYALPASRVPTDYFDRVRPFAETLDWLTRNAMDLKREPIRHAEPVYVFAVSLDRLGNGDRLVLDAGGRVAQTLLDIGGWQTAVSRFETPEGKPLTIRASYRSGESGRTVENVATLTLPGR